MKHNRLSLLSLLACVPWWSITFHAPESFAAQPDWKLVWSDEFESAELDTEKWEPIDWTTPYNNERQAYRPSHVSVIDGCLVLTADKSPSGGKEYTSGKVESRWAQQYGRWVIRARLPATRGTWPAIWLLPDTNKYPWPTQGEIDIMEFRGDLPTQSTSAYHWGKSSKKRKFLVDDHQLAQSDSDHAVDFSDDFHVFTVEWDPDSLRFFVDDKLHHTIEDSQTDGFISRQTAPAEILLNVAVGGDYLDDAQPDGSSIWPQKMLVDYVRVYSREPEKTSN